LADTVTNIADECRILLNDVGIQYFSDTVLLPYIQKAYDELQSKLRLNGIETVNEVSGLFIVEAATAPVLDTDDVTNIIQPIDIYERPSGSSDSFTLMDEQSWEPELDLTDRLRYWAWRENEIKFVGATIDIQVKIRYKKSLASLINGASTIAILGAKQFLSSRAAAIAAFSVGGSQIRASELNIDAIKHSEEFVASEVKRNQKFVVRRRPFRRGNFLR
jgi:hypothetical protein